jgi:hypothetical protein
MKLAGSHDFYVVQQVYLFSFIIIYQTQRSFKDSPIGRKIKDQIIPAIAHLRQLYPLKLNLVFPSSILNGLFSNPEIDCTDLSQNDYVFNQFMYQCV